ncbi:MAG: MATE family efflux transporter [Lentisphaerae bacterium]|nr:MATE family efflux transporter [Lentisphaerota bacterium]
MTAEHASRHNHIDLTRGSVAGHIWRMAPPMAVGFLALMTFNLADTWFVSRLGTQPLAAMGFTFPVVMLFYAASMGVGLGTSSCVSRAIGARDHDRVQHLATYSLLLSVLLMSLLAGVGASILPALLSGLGAEGGAKALAARYLGVWFLFAPVVTLPMVGNNAIRATGDTVRPALIMCSAALLNVALDPLLIFGWGPVPALGIAGAALATGLAQLTTAGWAIWLMHRKCRLLTGRWTGAGALLRAWGSVMHVAVPAAATNLLFPVTMGIVTRLIAGFGDAAVAATAAGQRIEHFAYLVPMGMGSALVPIIGQNWGAGRVDRVREAWVKTNIYGVLYAVLCAVLMIPLARPLARCFSRDPTVIRLITHYLWIILTGAILQHSLVHTGFSFNAIRKPLHAACLTFFRLVVMVLPLAWLGSRLFGVQGVYAGLATATVLSGLAALAWFRRIIRHAEAAAARADQRLA